MMPDTSLLLTLWAVIYHTTRLGSCRYDSKLFGTLLVSGRFATGALSDNGPMLCG